MKKYVIVSGANGGLGTKTVIKLAAEGYYVFALDLSNNNLIKNNNIFFIKADVTKQSDLDNALSIVKEKTNEVYAIINLAGIFKMESLVEGNEETLRKIFEVNFFGTYHLNKTFFSLLKNDSRVIVCSSEVARYSPQPFMAYYSTSKKMVDNYADVFRRECNYLGIKVIKVQSGALKTNMLSNAYGEYDTLIKNTKYFASPLTKLKSMMDKELTKTNNPNLLADTVSKILKKKHPKITYRIKNSFALRFMNALPEKVQDILYKSIIK